MNQYTIDQLRRKTTPILTELPNGPVEIVHRDRPPMVLILREHLEHIRERAEKNGAE